MYNRKFNIKKDFYELNRMENKIFPLLDKIEDTDEKTTIKNYVRELFHNQYKR